MMMDNSSWSESSDVAILAGGRGYADAGYGRSPKGLSSVFVIEWNRGTERSRSVICYNLLLETPLQCVGQIKILKTEIGRAHV